MPDDTKHKKHRYRFNWGRVKIVIVMAVLLYTVIALTGQQETLGKQLTRQDELMRRQAETEQELEYYVNELDYIGTDEYVEQEARNRFGWVRPGEIKYLEGDPGDTPTARPTASPGTEWSAEPTGSGDPDASDAAGESTAAASEPAQAASAAPSPVGSPTAPAEGHTLSPEQANANRRQAGSAG